MLNECDDVFREQIRFLDDSEQTSIIGAIKETANT